MHAPTASKENVPPPDLTRVVNHQPVPAAGTYQIDPAHTFADFTAQHLVIGHVRGRFTQLTGQITVAEDLTQSAASVTIAAASIDTHVDKRDGDCAPPATSTSPPTRPSPSPAPASPSTPEASGAWPATSRSKTSPARSSS
jgi:hypothetical protein